MFGIEISIFLDPSMIDASLLLLYASMMCNEVGFYQAGLLFSGINYAVNAIMFKEVTQ